MKHWFRALLAVVFLSASAAQAQTIDGAALYTQYCAGCHGSLANSSKKGRTASQIQSAINGVSSMRSLSFLTSAQVQAISTALATSVTCTGFTYSAWGPCQSNGTQVRTVVSASPAGCTGGNPVLTQACTPGPIVTCTSFTYSAWGACQPSNTQTRTVVSSSPAGCTGGSPILSQACTYVPPPVPTGTGFKVFGNNDLGMHCIDKDFSVFSMLPPFNILDAQVVASPPTGRPFLLDQSQVTLRYTPITDANGSVNSSSKNKSNFWKNSMGLFGADLAPGQGLTGLWMPVDAKQASQPLGATSLQWDPTLSLFRAFGVPITDTDDSGKQNTYPLMRVTAYNKSTGAFMASSDIVLPVSSETSCASCHATGAAAAKDPSTVWANDTDLEKQYRKNVLILHDKRNGTHLMANQPVLCASCHYSPALDLGGAGPSAEQQKHRTFSAALHTFHADKMKDAAGNPLWDKVEPSGAPPPAATVQACYKCHPGATTKCLRGAMTGVITCQNCHGGMSAVGGIAPLRTGGSIDGTNDGKQRRPWSDLPRCQSCHTGDATSNSAGIRAQVAFDQADPAASPRLATNKRFAEEPNKLFKVSKGHGGLACEACHGSTHAIWPGNANDNVEALKNGFRTGTISECSACHKTAPSSNLNGPHGMHPVGSGWVSAHQSRVSSLGRASCQTCHGTDYRGTVLSKTWTTRTLAGRTFQKGTVISCYNCHNGPNPD